MASLRRIKNCAIAKALTRYPSLSRFFIDSCSPCETDGIPWTPPLKPLSESKVALVTTARLHHKEQTPFDMKDRDGDPTFRVIDSDRPKDSLMITHDYYDHSDADKDINIVFPIDRLKEYEEEGVIGSVSNLHLSFMGHITGHHIITLLEKTSKEVAGLLKEHSIDIVLLTPG
jgi:D-proline reductase (dithiol) PrdB